MNEQQLRSEIGQINRRINELAEKKRELEDQLAKLKCPFAVGETIEWGFRRRDKGIVRSIRNRYGSWELCVQRFLKSGDLGTTADVSSVHKPIKVTT